MSEDFETHVVKVLMSPAGPVPKASDIEAWADAVIGIAKGLLERDGYASPVLMFLAPDKRDHAQAVQGVVPLIEFLSGSDDREEMHRKKDAMAQVLPQLLDEAKAFASVVITEAWMHTAEDGQDRDEMSRRAEEAGGVQGLRGSFEVLTALFETRKSSTMRSWRIERDAAGNPSTGDEVFPGEEPVKVEGRFVSFLHAIPGGRN
jgi:hypothetical protein